MLLRLQNQNPPRGAGFTLVELVVAMAVAVFALGAVMALLCNQRVNRVLPKEGHRRFAGR